VTEIIFNLSRQWYCFLGARPIWRWWSSMVKFDQMTEHCIPRTLPTSQSLL